MGSGAVSPAGRQGRRQRHVCTGHRQEHTEPAGGASDGQRVCTAQTGGELRGARVGSVWEVRLQTYRGVKWKLV